MPETTKLYKRNHCPPKISFSSFDSLTKSVTGNLNLRLFCGILIWTIIVTLIAGCDTNQNSPNQNLPPNNSAAKPPERIISTTPAITELLFDIGLGGKIVGDSQFTAYPPEAEKIEKIGGLYDKNIEKIISLAPDLVIFPIEDVQFDQQLQQMKFRSLPVDHRSISGLLESYELVGKIFGGIYLEQAANKRQAIDDFLRECKLQVEGKKKLRVLTVIDRQHGTGRIDNVFIAGSELFFGEVLSFAGGENVAANVGVPYPNISTEAIIDFNPDVIIDLQVITDKNKTTEDNLRADWDTLKDVVPAVKRGNVFIITDRYATIPGPRIQLLIKKISGILDSCREIKQ
ncbi:MAG: helical backbone metal receptor [Planctomycetaceae bacterium]|nr:helical backbone metal receptor [Planctomycetaceae bacterium]